MREHFCCGRRIVTSDAGRSPAERSDGEDQPRGRLTMPTWPNTCLRVSPDFCRRRPLPGPHLCVKQRGHLEPCVCTACGVTIVPVPGPCVPVGLQFHQKPPVFFGDDWLLVEPSSYLEQRRPEWSAYEAAGRIYARRQWYAGDRTLVFINARHCAPVVAAFVWDGVERRKRAL